MFCREVFGAKPKNLEFGLQPTKIPETDTVRHLCPIELKLPPYAEKIVILFPPMCVVIAALVKYLIKRIIHLSSVI